MHIWGNAFASHMRQVLHYYKIISNGTRRATHEYAFCQNEKIALSLIQCTCKMHSAHRTALAPEKRARLTDFFLSKLN